MTDIKNNGKNAEDFTDLLKENNTSDKALQDKINKLCDQIHEMSKNFDDAGEFTDKFMTSDLYGNYTNLLSDMIVQNNGLIAQTQAAEDETRRIVEQRNAIPIENANKDQTAPLKEQTLHGYLAPYREAYEKIKDIPYRSEAKKAYEALLEVENRTSDLNEALCIIEQEELLFKIMKNDLVQIYETVLAGSDTLSDNSCLQPKRHLAAWKKANCEQEAVYLAQSHTSSDEASSNLYTAKMIMAQKLAGGIASYYENKLDVLEWKSDIAAQNGLKDMIADRRNVKHICEVMKEELGFGFEDIANDEKMKIWLLSPSQLDETGRIKRCLPPNNINVLRALLAEIMSDKLTSELLTEGKTYDYVFSSLAPEATQTAIKEKCAELDKDNEYLKNKNAIDALLAENI